MRTRLQRVRLIQHSFKTPKERKEEAKARTRPNKPIQPILKNVSQQTSASKSPPEPETLSALANFSSAMSTGNVCLVPTFTFHMDSALHISSSLQKALHFIYQDKKSHTQQTKNLKKTNLPQLICSCNDSIWLRCNDPALTESRYG